MKMTSSCNDCSNKIGFFKKKHTCQRCLKVFCGHCFSKTSHLISKPTAISKSCLKCHIFALPILRREELLLLSTRDLKCFLTSRNISINNCKEKYHLVDLIMKFAEDNGQTSVTDLRREENRRVHVENLRLEAQRRNMEERVRVEITTRSTNNEQALHDFQQNLPGTPLHFNTTQPSKKWKSIEDICSLDDIYSLSVRELKKILTVNFVDYKGCFEKSELTDRVKRLWSSKNGPRKEKSESRDGDQGAYDEDLCKICMDSAIDCVLLDCGHMVSCTKCGRRLHECPVCRQLVVRVVHVFKA